MEATETDSVMPDSILFDHSSRFPDDDLLDGDCNQGVTWLNDEENDNLDMSLTCSIDPSNLFFNRVNSAEIIYAKKKTTCKMIGKYVMGDILGEGNPFISKLDILLFFSFIKNVHTDNCFVYIFNIHLLIRFIWKSKRSFGFRNVSTTCSQSNLFSFL